jgi:Dopey, N-terminal
MPEPSFTDWSPPASIGSLHPYLGSFGCMSYIIFLVGTTEELIQVRQMDGLKRDLSLWSSGLFPFFEYAATSVKVRVFIW